MQFDISIAMTWILFLAQFPIVFYWLRRAWRIVVQRNFSEVALSRGEPPLNPERYAPFAAGINLVCGAVLVYNIASVLFFSPSYSTWSAVAGVTIWMKIMLDFILARHARMYNFAKKS